MVDPLGEVLLGRLAKQAVLRRRGGVSLTWTETHDTEWEKNLIRWRAEVRAVLAIKQPSAFVVADLTA